MDDKEELDDKKDLDDKEELVFYFHMTIVQESFDPNLVLHRATK